MAEDRSAAAYSRLRKHLDAGRQAYVVCPLIEESETTQARAAEVEAERLQRAELRGYRVGLLHGRLRPPERRELMARFKARDLDVLVALLGHRVQAEEGEEQVGVDALGPGAVGHDEGRVDPLQGAL